MACSVFYSSPGGALTGQLGSGTPEGMTEAPALMEDRSGQVDERAVDDVLATPNAKRRALPPLIPRDGNAHISEGSESNSDRPAANAAAPVILSEPYNPTIPQDRVPVKPLASAHTHKRGTDGKRAFRRRADREEYCRVAVRAA